MTRRGTRCGAGRSPRHPSASVNIEMSTDPDQIRAQVAALLAELPEPAGIHDPGDQPPDEHQADVEAVAARLEEAHDVLVAALESVEKGRSPGIAG